MGDEGQCPPLAARWRKGRRWLVAGVAAVSSFALFVAVAPDDTRDALLLPSYSAEALRLSSAGLVERDSTEELHSLILVDEQQRKVTAFLRQPVGRDQPLPTIVLVAGRHAGRDAARLVPAPLEAVVLAVEYPREIPHQLGLLASLRRLPAIRATAKRMPGILVGAAHFAAGLPQVDGERIGLVGVSFGVPFAAAAGRDPVFGAVVLAYGGAGFSELLEANLPMANDWLRTASARIASWWFKALEPDLHVAAIAPRPLLLINGIYDELVPPSSALRLARAAAQPVEHVWLPNRHIGVLQAESIREVTSIVVRFLEGAWRDDGEEPEQLAERRAERLSAQLALTARGPTEEVWPRCWRIIRRSSTWGVQLSTPRFPLGSLRGKARSRGLTP